MTKPKPKKKSAVSNNLLMTHLLDLDSKLTKISAAVHDPKTFLAYGQLMHDTFAKVHAEIRAVHDTLAMLEKSYSGLATFADARIKKQDEQIERVVMLMQKIVDRLPKPPVLQDARRLVDEANKFIGVK